ncbi:DUF6049 family protein [Cellulomonas sp. ICMP 17802]|uniref:DUF6049 family protein n=1 Tax=Cellulomonas sp. ICMP 17802 TaxID=3239199 RepID=UPI00351AC069
MSARSLRRRVLCAALAVAGALASVALPASAATKEPDLPVSVQITSVSPSVLRPGEDLQVHAVLRNDGDTAIARPSAALRLSRFRVSSRAEVDAWAQGGASGLGRTSRVATAPVAAPLAPGASIAVDLVVPAAGIRLLDGADTWGPRGLVVEALDGSDRVGLQRTFLLWLTTDDVPQVPVSILVPAVGPPSAPAPAEDGAGPDEQTVAALDELTAPGGRLHDLATAVATDPDIGVAVDPALLAAASAGTPRTRTWATELTDELRTHDVVALPWSDPDIAAAAHAQHADLVQVAVDRTAQADTSGLDAASGLLWAPGAELPDQTTAAVTSQVGADLLVLPPRTDADARVTPDAHASAHTTVGTVATLGPDRTLTQLLAAPRTVDPGATTTTTVQRALAELAVISREASDPPRLLLAPDRAWVPDLPNVTALLTALQSSPWVRVAPVATLRAVAANPTRTTLPAESTGADELAPASVRAVADARERAIAFASVTSEPAILLEGVDTAVLAPLSVAWRAEPAGRDALVTSVVDEVDARTTGLSIARVSDVRVVAADSELPIVVRNTLAVPATVLLEVTPRKACLEVGDIEPVAVDAESELSVRIPLHARANCSVVVTARLTATDGLAVSPTVRFTAQVAPTIESIGTIVVGVLLAIGLVLGIVRTVRRGQSGRRGARTVSEADAPTTLPVLGGTPEDEQEPR